MPSGCGDECCLFQTARVDWPQQGKLTASDPESGDYFGRRRKHLFLLRSFQNTTGLIAGELPEVGLEP
ncbi:MAG: FG-GAP repeat protein, partial [Phycisphaerae bacterium]|nr:FG-GAP repeat protein [Phycisphaerae bacterium]